MSRDHRTTLALAKLALNQITNRTLPADPPCFEFWYVYESGTNPSLNGALDALIAAKGTLTLEDVDELYDQFLSPLRTLMRVDNLGTRISYELTRAIDALDDTTTVATTYRRNLDSVARKLETSSERIVTRSTILRLISLSQDMENKLRLLESTLQSSRGQIAHLQEDLLAIRLENLTDFLTGVGNRKQFELWIETMLKQTPPEGTLAILLIDIDAFKSFNDRFGHAVGDQILRLVANAIKHSIGGDDRVARYGGDEFAVILAAADAARAEAVADTIRQTVAARELVNRTTGQILGRIGVSIGMAIGGANVSSAGLIEQADRSMYHNKHAGRGAEETP